MEPLPSKQILPSKINQHTNSIDQKDADNPVRQKKQRIRKALRAKKLRPQIAQRQVFMQQVHAKGCGCHAAYHSRSPLTPNMQLLKKKQQKYCRRHAEDAVVMILSIDKFCKPSRFVIHKMYKKQTGKNQYTGYCIACKAKSPGEQSASMITQIGANQIQAQKP